MGKKTGYEKLSFLDDPIWKTKYFLKLPEFTGKQKYFWVGTTVLKIVLLMAATTFAYQNLQHPKTLTALVATYPVRIMAVWKLLHLYFDKKRVDYLFDTVHTEFWNFDIAGPAVDKQIKRRFLLTNLFVLIHVSLSTICVTLFILSPLVEVPGRKRSLPNVIWAPFDTDPSPLHEVLYVILLWNMYVSIYGNLFYDMLYVYCVQHLYVQFTLLKELIQNLSAEIMEGESDVDRFNSEYFQAKVMERLKICAEHHNRLLKQKLLRFLNNTYIEISRYGRNIEDFCKGVLAPQLFMSFAVLVINGYNLSMDTSKSFSQNTMLFNLTFSSFVQLAVYALQATDLHEQSLSILNAVIECRWYLFKSPIKRALTFILMNAENGIVINAAGMATIDNPLLVEVIQKAFFGYNSASSLYQRIEAVAMVDGKYFARYIG
ncbi:hypothetical protein NQ317_015076 [Molorchus minor]|uniref:Odorant receptor n=1 Tax=Molorchus minor TaxID=1323400 RepID=A0ABQ9K4Q7_9CUCU|nr:hypothetical protein NQ317_015076 [Molorchus minor]